jgi:hypothetical protein
MNKKLLSILTIALVTFFSSCGNQKIPGLAVAALPPILMEQQ